MTEDKQTQDSKPLSLTEEARAIRDEILKAKDELKAENDRKEKINAENLLSSSAGRHIDSHQITEEELKKQEALNFFKGTEIERAINTHG